MSPFSLVMTMLFDPRGRTNREGLLFAAVALVVLKLAALYAVPPQASFAAPLSASLNGFALWIAGVSIVKRLHDCGVSGWALLGGVAALCMWTAVVALTALFIFGRNTLVASSPGYTVVLGLVMMPIVGATLWLHLQAGEVHSNRFGSAVSPGWMKKPVQHTEIV